MATIVLGSYMVRYPLGGMMSYVLQYLVGLDRLGHDVYFVETASYWGACFDPVTRTMTNDCSAGIAAVSALLERVGLGDRWAFVDDEDRFHGLDRRRCQDVCRHSDVFLDMGTHGEWRERVDQGGLHVLLDGEPGYNQILMGEGGDARLDGYDRYYTNGLNVGTASSPAPTAGKDWHHLPHPVVPELFRFSVPAGGPFTTVMNWQSHRPVTHQGVEYGQKDVEFARFRHLPSLVDADMEVAVAGAAVPADELEAAGWSVVPALDVTSSYDSFIDYIERSRGEFGVCKNVFVALHTGWFSDRSAAYLAAGRPVVLQDTGFGDHLPLGEGLFAVSSAEEAAAAITEVCNDQRRHSLGARRIAEEALSADLVLGRFLAELGV